MPPKPLDLHRARAVTAVLTLAALATLAACASEEEQARAEANRDLVRGSTPQSFGALLRASYAAHRECIERDLPAQVTLSPGDTSRAQRLRDERALLPFELLREAGLVEREEVRPGDEGWRYLPPSASIDSGGTKRIVRYVLTERGRPYVGVDTVASGPRERLCYGRRRLLTVDSVVMHGPLPRWSPDEGVRYDGASASVLHSVVVDSLAPWASALARRDSLRDLMPVPEAVERPRKLWATFHADDGRWGLTGTAAFVPP